MTLSTIKESKIVYKTQSNEHTTLAKELGMTINDFDENDQRWDDE